MGERVRADGLIEPPDVADPVATLLRWERAGGVWRVLGRDEEKVSVGLFTCDAGEEMDRFTSADERLLALLDTRRTSEA